jgi:hypothetical protein
MPSARPAFLLLAPLASGCPLIDVVTSPAEELIDLAVDLTDDLSGLSAREAQHAFCRHSEATSGRVSVRTGLGLDPDPVLCYDSGYYSGTKLLGGLALAVCWDTPDAAVQGEAGGYDTSYNEDDGVAGNGYGPGWEGFQDSNCAADALAEWGLDSDSFEASRDVLQSALESYAGGDFAGSESEETFTSLICALPASLDETLDQVQGLVCP